MLGKIKSPEDFIVKEAIEKKFLKKFVRTKTGIEKTKGPYTLFLLKKRNLTTQQAIRLVAKEMKIKESEIGYAGLKDKFAVTYQYITIKNSGIGKITIDNIELTKVGYCNNMISVGNLNGNEFEIALHGCKINDNKIKIILDKIMKNGMPNYFGEQRFGKNDNNHITGRFLIKRDFSKALKIINKNHENKFSEINQVPKRLLKFLINAYQSWLFNETVRIYLKAGNNPCFTDIPVFGYRTKLEKTKFDAILKNLIEKEHIKQEDFMISELSIRCDGGHRQAFIKFAGINYKINNSKLMLKFMLPRGSYATALLNEIDTMSKVL
jgi:tRNA(Glu) U13 pseudouridine synthase TruD